MRAIRIVCATVFVAFVGARSSAVAQRRDVLSWDDVVVLARRQGPAVVAARAGLGEARARVAGARALLPDNPTLFAGAGPRWGAGPVALDVEAGISQRVGLGGGRGDRLAAARAHVESARLGVQDAARRAIFEAAEQFVHAVHARERVTAAADTEREALRLLDVAERRAAAGDGTGIDVQLARASLAAARSDVSAARAESAIALAGLRIALDLDEGRLAGVAGDVPIDGDAPISSTPGGRPGVRALRSLATEADASARASAAARWPALELGVSWLRERDEMAVVGSLAIELPLFARAQGETAEALARAGRLRTEARTLSRVASARAAGSRSALSDARVAATEAQSAVAALVDAEQLAMRAWTAGELRLPDALAIRRLRVEANASLLDRRREAGLLLARLMLDDEVSR